MTAEEVKAWAPIIQTTVGIVGTILAGVFGVVVSHVATSRRDRSNRELEAKERREQKRVGQRMDSLLGLQDAIEDMIQALFCADTSRAFLDSMQTNERCLNFSGLSNVEAKLVVEYRNDLAKTLMLRQRCEKHACRVDDGSLNRLLENFYEQCENSNAPIDHSAKEGMLESGIAGTLSDLNDRIRALMREMR